MKLTLISNISKLYIIIHIHTQKLGLVNPSWSLQVQHTTRWNSITIRECESKIRTRLRSFLLWKSNWLKKSTIIRLKTAGWSAFDDLEVQKIDKMWWGGIFIYLFLELYFWLLFLLIYDICIYYINNYILINSFFICYCLLFSIFKKRLLSSFVSVHWHLFVVERYKSDNFICYYLFLFICF